MKKKELKNETDEKLKSELKKTKMISGALIGVLIPLFALTIYGLVTAKNKSTNIALLAVAISCSGILPMQFDSIKKIKRELASRTNHN